MIDLSHNVHPAVPTWSGSCGFDAKTIMTYEQGVYVQKFTMHASIGTHMDAPLHFIPKAESVGEIPLEKFIAPICCIDVSERSAADLQVTPEDLLAFEKEHGRIERGDIVIANTGWHKHWMNPEVYGTKIEEGRKRFPTFHPDCIEILVTRDVVAIGIDSFSPDPAGSGFPIHHALLGRGKYILENLNNLDQLPPRGATLYAFPPKFMDAAECPVRAVAFL